MIKSGYKSVKPVRQNSGFFTDMRQSVQGRLLTVEHVINTRAIQWSLTGQSRTLDLNPRVN